MIEKPKNGPFDGSRLPEGDGIRKIGVLERTNGQGQKTTAIQYAVASAVGAAVVLVTEEGRGDTFADYVRDFNNPANLRVLGSEVNTPGTHNRHCSITPDGHLRWRRGSGGSVSILEIPFNLNTDGSMTMVPPATTIYGPSDTDTFDENFRTVDYDFLLNNLPAAQILTRTADGFPSEEIINAPDFPVWNATRYKDDISIAFGADPGTTRGGLTRDTGDIYLLPATHPSTIRTAAEFRRTAIRIPSLSPDPPDGAEALQQLRAVFGQNTGHAFVTEVCGRALSDCGVDSMQNTQDIYIYEINPDVISWNPISKTSVSSTPIRNEMGSCVLDNNIAEVLFTESVIDGRYQISAVPHCKDPDNDGVHNCRGDNCPVDANADQSNLDRDAMGDACDPCPLDATNDASDLDGICDDEDNCVSVSNADQSDRDMDEIGDACDTCPDDRDNDMDRDGICGDVDNCPDIPNPGQENTYGDARGDACEPPPVMDAGMEGGIDGGRDAGMDNEGDTGLDASSDRNVDAGRDAGMDGGRDAGRDAGIDVQQDIQSEQHDVIVVNEAGDIVHEQDESETDAHEMVPPSNPGCSCDIPQSSAGSLDAFQMAFVIVTVAQGIRRKIFGKKKVSAKS